MTSAGVLRSIALALESVGIPFMLTGSFAAAYHGVPRATMDIDLVIDPSEAQLRALILAVEASGQYASIDAALGALRHETLFNVIDPDSGWKIDLIIRKSRAFSRLEFDRRSRINFDGVTLAVATVEDVVLSKLEWAKLGGSARQLEDVAGLLKVHAGELDREYLRQWVEGLGVGAQWEAALRLAEL